MKQCAIDAATEKNTTGRTIALFPGAFRPPHRAHFETVHSLASRRDIDEVVVIITNRCRHVPGTTKALDTEVAEKIWSIFLQDVAKVRVEVAPNSAVKQAISYFERVNDEDTLLFCAGESVLKQGRGRFSKVGRLSRQFGIPATVISSPASKLSGGATALRAYLADGDSGREAFITALPNHLSATQCEEVWKICCQGMREMHDITKDKIRTIIGQQRIGEIENISSAKNAKTDEVHCVQLSTGKRLFVKYANDTVKAAKLGQQKGLKPRTRIYAERRALKWLANQNNYGVELPDVIYFENKSKTLVLSEVCPGGHFLEDDIKQGIFDPVVAWKASAFLAQCHSTPVHVEPFWDDAEADLQHWKNLLSLRTIGLQSDDLPEQMNQCLATLKCVSGKSNRPGFYHLDYCPKNIRLHGNEIGVIDFELSSSIGDPAYDFGFLLGHYLFWGIVTSSLSDCHQTLHTAIQSYREVIDNSWPVMCPRIVAFTGAAIIYSLKMNKQPLQMEIRLLNIATALLKHGLDSFEEINQIFHRVFNNGYCE
jgi:tRNA A-37 threonylcarbamoyl transferase component Bud32/nicotinic acid mononucleotide adenylyltransferase